MFDFFSYKPLAAQREPEPLWKYGPVGETVTESSDYTVGVNLEGKTLLRVNSPGFGAMTLTMNAAGVQQLISLLQATLPREDTP